MLFNAWKTILRLLGVMLLAAPAAPGALGVQAGAENAAPAFDLPCSFFPPDSIWNTRVDTLPVDANSDAYVASIGADRSLHPDFGTVWDGKPNGIPYNLVLGSQPKVPIDFYYPDESDPGPYPIPPNPKIEKGPPEDCEGDCHILVLDQDNCLLYEVYDAHPKPGGNSWDAGSGAVFDLNSNALRPAGWTSADAAGLPMLPGLVRYDEVAGGQINHALRFTVLSTAAAYTWPARHKAPHGSDPFPPPMGQRFRLKAGVDISGFSPEVQVILQALKTYGMMVSDNGGNWYLSGAPDERWDDDALHELQQLHGSDFEAVDVSGLMVDADSGQALSPGAVRAPLLQWPPANAALTFARPALAWQGANQGAETGFDLRINQSADPQAQPWLADVQLGAGVSTYEVGLAAAGRYYWHVRARTAQGESLWATRAFTLSLPRVQKPTLTSPASGAAVSTFTPRLAWRTARRAALGFDLQLAAARDGFDPPLAQWFVPPAGVKTGTAFRLPQELPAAGRYYWRVRSTNGLEVSAWSRVRSFLSPPEAYGVVRDALSGTPLPGLTVTVKGSTLNTQTDENGAYRLRGLRPGWRTLLVSGGGYAGRARLRAVNGRAVQKDIPAALP